QRPLALPAGTIDRVNDSIPRVTPFPSERQHLSTRRVLLGAKMRSQLNEVGNPLGPFTNQNVDCVFTAEAGAGSERVLLMERHIVIARHGPGNTTLRIVAVRFGPVFFGKDQGVAVPGCQEGVGEAGDPAADYEEVE